MPKLTPPKQRGLIQTVFIFLLVFSYESCYSEIIVPSLSAANGSKAWVLNNITTGSGYWDMNKPGASVETAEFYNFNAFSDITIESTIRTLYDYNFCFTRLEISADGLNWKELATNKDTANNKTGRTFSFQVSSLPYKQGKIRLIATNQYNNAGARLISIDIEGSLKFIPTPIGNKATKITSNSFTCSWDNCNNATDYEVNIYKKIPGKAEKQILNEDFRNLNSAYNDVKDSVLKVYLPRWNGNTVYSYAQDVGNTKCLKIGKGNSAGYIEIMPQNLSGNNGRFQLSFDIGSFSNPKPVNLYINNVLVYSINTSNTSDTALKNVAYSFTNGTDSCIIKLEKPIPNSGAFVLDNIIITQLLDGVETSVIGYPKNIGNITSYTAENLPPNTTHFFTVKATNGLLTTNKSNEICVKTLSGDQVVIDSKEEKVFDNDTINGDLCIKEGAKISGKVTVTGEICYICRFIPDKWHSISLPFIPHNVGGYIDGKGYSLRANYDYILKSYQNESFTNATFGNEGYIIKILSNKIDNNELLFFSDKGITLNEYIPQYAISSGYTHLGNPYTYSINPKELVNADKYYYLRNNKFIESKDDLFPFESLIVYKESSFLTQPLYAIYPEPINTALPTNETENVKIWQNKGVLWITGTDSPISVYSAQGEIIYTGTIEGKKSIALPNGIYLVKTKSLISKIIIN
ncbi:hypothetical protein [uncultured Bacteroides sp.]|uniref:hypothetical protein n=1 Tax=uncultured Bacteroides sp. TaxID=162156 RepID=UPI002AAA68CF|nr:hypothetical protein [uncultured Bacteroides sp.]